VIGTLNGAANPLVVIGATITVRSWLFNSGGEMTTQGRDFLILLPMVGSRLTNQISPRFTTGDPHSMHRQTHP
jgi:hypothetical protein